MKRTRAQKRVEDFEDLRDLESAIAENSGKPLIPWEQVKANGPAFSLEIEQSISAADHRRVTRPSASCR